MTNELVVVVEQRMDALVLRRLLERALGPDPTFYPAREGVSVGSLGRSILVHEGGPVLVLMDTFTTHPDRVEEARGMTHFATSQVAVEWWFEVFAFAPELDVIFFEAPCVLRRHFGRAIEGMELELGRLDPRRQLDRLLAEAGTDRETFYRALGEEELDHLLAGAQMKALLAASRALLGKFEAFARAYALIA